MKKKVLAWFNTPYYFNPSLSFKFKTSVIFGFSVFIFLYVFKPFSLSLFGNYFLQYTAAIGIFTFLGSFFMLSIPPLIFPDFFNEDKWTIGKNTLYLFLATFLIGYLLWYASNLYKDGKELPVVGLPLFLTYTFLVGTIPIFFSVYLNERNLRRNRVKKIEEIKLFRTKKEIEYKKALKNDITIYSDNKKEKLHFNINDLVYATSQGNYVSFFLKDEKKHLKEKILRVTLSKIDKELEPYSKIIRCHKSYIINTIFVNDISGNARGYLLKSDIISFDIPVSRSFSKQSLMSFLD
ncbi:LytR/AlgR family response regulator transcription factor [Polaribacter sp.]|uniref:LytR/AlgR family response regulator transcription factor n=1 Tax=Polaribacter sp. TaxID=1920175 RepID=UPI003F6AA2E5